MTKQKLTIIRVSDETTEQSASLELLKEAIKPGDHTPDYSGRVCLAEIDEAGNWTPFKVLDSEK